MNNDKQTQNKDKVIRDGKVAVIYSPGYGAGWSTWASIEGIEFEPMVVEWIENGKQPHELGDLENKLTDKYGYVYTGGLDDAVIRWVEKGGFFKITEYDGSESLQVVDHLPDYFAQA